LPHVAEDYVHRIGRTGRAGAEGEAVSFVSVEERPLLAAIERLMNRKVEQKTVPALGQARNNTQHHAPRHQPQPQPPRPHRQAHAPQGRRVPFLLGGAK
jgi:ATP-dependent RNA helicase RhlE